MGLFNETVGEFTLKSEEGEVREIGAKIFPEQKFFLREIGKHKNFYMWKTGKTLVYLMNKT